MNDTIIITTGDPNGIGAEIAIKALKELKLDKERVILVSNRNVLNFYGGENLEYNIVEIPFDIKKITPGKNTKEGGEFSYLSLKKACELCPKAVVTAPVSKEALHLAGHYFNGQTEILEKFLSHDGQKAEMLFVANNFRVLLLTRHVALKDVTITKSGVINKVLALNETLKKTFHISQPRLALCGLNPHAGEDGILGDEEQKILIPAVEELRLSGILISDPKPSDTLFYRAGQNYFKNIKDEYDCYIAIYHDQGLIPIKTVAGMKTVNTTIGLDILRTSPGHGTAFDIAGKNIADPLGMICAIKSVLETIH